MTTAYPGPLRTPRLLRITLHGLPVEVSEQAPSDRIVLHPVVLSELERLALGKFTRTEIELPSAPKI